MKRILMWFLLLSLLMAESPQQIANIGNFTLESGKVINSCQIGYRIIGTVNSDSSNIILYPTWFGGASEHIISLIEKHRVIDPEKYLIIAIDALGNGISTSPSNYTGKLPVFSIKDMVNAEYQVMTETLKIEHLYAIVGGSMGSFQTFQWLVSYPDFMDKAIPYVCSPKRTSSDKLWLNLEKDILLLHRDYDIPEGQSQRIMEILTAYIARTQNHLSRTVSVEDFEEYYTQFKPEKAKIFTIDNRLSQINAMLQHDITAEFGNSLKQAGKNIKAEMLIIVSDSDQIVNPAPAMELAEMTNSELVVLSNECGHLAPGCDMKLFAEYIHKFLDEQSEVNK